MGRVTDETGNRYGRLTVVRRDPENAYHKGANWICRCDCGGERVASGIGLRQGMVKSCGCLARERRVLRCACGYKGQKTRNWTPDWKCYRCSGLSPLAEPPKMTEDELFEKRVEHWRYYHRSAPTSASHDVMLFLERLEKVTKERDMAIEQHRHSQHEVGRWVDRETKAVRELDEARERNTDLRTMLEQVTRERDEARADLREFVRQVENAYELLEPLEEGSDVVERAVSHLLTVLRGRERPGPWAFDAVLRERDEARAQRDAAIARITKVGVMVATNGNELAKDAFRRGAEAMRKRCEEIARHACSVIGGLEHTYGLMTPGHVDTVSRLILEADIPEEP